MCTIRKYCEKLESDCLKSALYSHFNGMNELDEGTVQAVVETLLSRGESLPPDLAEAFHEMGQSAGGAERIYPLPTVETGL